MILASDVYLTLLDVARKDLRGLSISVEEYNNVAKLVNETLFNKYYAEFEGSLENSSTMSGFKVLGYQVALVAGVGTIPNNYYELVGMPRYTDAGGTTRYLDVVSAMEHAKREQDYLTKATLTHPTCRFGIVNATADMTIHVTPTTFSPIYIDYIRVPNTPFLDYYVSDSTLVYTWMSSGGVVTAVPAGSTARDGTIGAANVASLTVDWEFDNTDLPLIINLFLQHLGIQLPSAELYEGGTLGEQKSDAL